MKQRLKQYAIIAAAGALLWFVMDNHFIIYGNQVRLLKKSTLDLHDTFVSLNNKKPKSVMQNERLREDGIGNLMVEMGIITEDERSEIENKLNYAD